MLCHDIQCHGNIVRYSVFFLNLQSVTKMTIMKNIDSVKDTYNRLKSGFGMELFIVRKRMLWTSVARMVLFIAGIAGLIFFYERGFWAVCAVAFLVFVPFLILVKYYGRLNARKRYLEKSVLVCSQELNATDYDWSDFEDGAAFADGEHSYSNDLDLFGDKSLYRMLNRTCTPDGSSRLASMMKNHSVSKADIDRYSEAVRELSSHTDFRIDYRVAGLINCEHLLDVESLKEWGRSRPVFYRRKIYSVLPVLVFSVNVMLIALGMADYVSYFAFGLFFSVSAVVSFMFSGRISKVQSVYGKRLKSLETYSRLLERIEKSSFCSSHLKDVRVSLGRSGKPASGAISRLNRLMNELDQRNNFLVYFILNGLYFWELRQMIRIEKWKVDNMDELPVWISAVAEYDAFCSLATYAFNNPDNVYPEIIEGDFRYEAKALGHPMMRLEQCVCNDISIEKNPYFIIVTGANMAGKSTYLRTVGVNYLFACMGLPVRAESMRISPVRLVTSLRTTDSLMDNESYFFAELKRLKMIIDRLRSGEKLFIILDEILKGTNSVDKQKGSLALVSQLLDLGADGIIATHDLMLGSLRERFPDRISNYCFEADIKNNELSFSYRIREGVAQNMNACFLMNKMGIAVVE